MPPCGIIGVAAVVTASMLLRWLGAVPCGTPDAPLSASIGKAILPSSPAAPLDVVALEMGLLPCSNPRCLPKAFGSARSLLDAKLFSLIPAVGFIYFFIVVLSEVQAVVILCKL